jgi:DNA replication protein DnaC
MNAAMSAMLLDNLKMLRLSTMIQSLSTKLRQATEGKITYEEFLLNLTEIEVQVRRENGRKRRIKEAGFPLHKPLETFDFEAAGDLDVRYIQELTTGGYIEEKRNVIFLGKSGTGNYVKHSLM